MKNLLLLAHTPSPNTLSIAEAIVTSTQLAASDINTVYKLPLEATASDILNADGVIIFTPENFGYMSGALKDFFDRTYYDTIEQKRGMPYALIIRAGNDGTGCKRAVESIVSGLGWRQIQTPLILRGDFSMKFHQDAAELAGAFAAGLGLGIL